MRERETPRFNDLPDFAAALSPVRLACGLDILSRRRQGDRTSGQQKCRPETGRHDLEAVIDCSLSKRERIELSV